MTTPCYVAMGDSFTAGSEPGIAPFPDRVAAQLGGWRYLNVAAAGARSADVVALQLDRALAASPVLVSVVCGANDVVRTTRPEIPAFAANFNELLARLRAEVSGVTVVTATYPPVSEFLGLRERTRARIAAGLEEVNAVIRRLSAHHGAACLELAAHPGRVERENFAADGFHPSAAGHRRAAAALGACLSDRLGIELDQEGAAA